MSEDPAMKKLKENIFSLCLKTKQGISASKHWTCKASASLRAAAILLSILGSAGLIATKLTNNISSEVGWQFWGSMLLLIFSAISQIASEFGIAKKASDSQTLAFNCKWHYDKMVFTLDDADPRVGIQSILSEVKALFLDREINKVIPLETEAIRAEAKRDSDSLINDKEGRWDLKARPSQRGFGNPL